MDIVPLVNKPNVNWVFLREQNPESKMLLFYEIELFFRRALDLSKEAL